MKAAIISMVVLFGSIIGITLLFPNQEIDNYTTTQTVEFTTKEETTIEVTTEETTAVAEFATTAETTTEPETTTEALPDYYPFSYDEVCALAKMVYGEAQTSPYEQKRWVVMVALNHYDQHCNGGYSLWDIVTDTNQFNGYSSSHPVTSENYGVAVEIIQLWNARNNGAETDWQSFYFFSAVGDGVNNRFW